MEKFPLNPAPMFADRGTDVAEAMRYATEVAGASNDSIAIYTAVNVVMNTVINWVNAQSDQSAADQLEAGIMTSVCAWLDKNAATVIGQVLSDSEVVDRKVQDWCSDSATDVIEHWLEYDADLSGKIEEALENVDLHDKIEGVLEVSDLSSHIEAAIQDMDLVVRVR